MDRLEGTEAGTTGVRVSRMHPWTHGNRLFGFDPDLRRLWIAGQRLHHGVTGIAVLSAGLAGMLAGRTDLRRAIGWTLAGGALIAHDWKDRAVWFQPGPQSD